MAKNKNKGQCTKRSLQVFEDNLCDYFEPHKKGSKKCCKNCIHFASIKDPPDIDQIHKET